MKKWKDETSYSQSEEISKRVPRTYHYRTELFNIIVHRHMAYPKNVWLMTIHKLSIEDKVLLGTSIEQATAEALNTTRQHIVKLRECLNR